MAPAVDLVMSSLRSSLLRDEAAPLIALQQWMRAADAERVGVVDLRVFRQALVSCVPSLLRPDILTLFNHCQFDTIMRCRLHSPANILPFYTRTHIHSFSHPFSLFSLELFGLSHLFCNGVSSFVCADCDNMGRLSYEDFIVSIRVRYQRCDWCQCQCRHHFLNKFSWLHFCCHIARTYSIVCRCPADMMVLVLVLVQGPNSLNQLRSSLVTAAFSSLDVEGLGHIDLLVLEREFDAARHPHVLARVKTLSQVRAALLAGLGPGFDIKGRCTEREFENYYANISATIDSDDFFDAMMQNVWRMSDAQMRDARKSTSVCRTSAPVLHDAPLPLPRPRLNFSPESVDVVDTLMMAAPPASRSGTQLGRTLPPTSLTSVTNASTLSVPGSTGHFTRKRQELVLTAFRSLDKAHIGILDFEDVGGKFDASQHPEVCLSISHTR